MIDPGAIVASLDAGEEALLDAQMRTALYHHGRRTARVVVLLHGLTASPRTWREFALARRDRGETVLVPRLPRHGHVDRQTRALSALGADELTVAAQRILAAAESLGDEIVLVGHSLGGALALHLAHADERVARAIAIAPFLGIRRLPHDFNAFARAVVARTPNLFIAWDPLDPRGTRLPGHGYPRYATRALAAGLSIADTLRADAAAGPPRARRVEIVRNAFESAVSNRAIDDLVARWRRAGGQGVRVHTVTGLGHSHDIVEPERPRAPALRFLPALHRILDSPAPETDVTIDLGRER